MEAPRQAKSALCVCALRPKSTFKQAEKILTSQNILQFPYLSNMSGDGITKPSRD